MQSSRKRNSIYNFITSMGGQILIIVLSFVTRTVFINALGSAYLGINGLFSNILSMLSLAEFGVGHAILYKMYEPLAKQDEERLAALTKFYREVYRIIGVLVAVVGMCLIPFLPKLIDDYDNLQNLSISAPLIFILYLFNSVSSYLFFAYKSGIIKASQKEYILNIIGYGTTILQCVAQIFVLKVFKSFVLYVVVMIVCVIIQNIVGAIVADKKFPFINKKTAQKVEKAEIKEILKDCSALFLYRINGVVLKSTDTIVLSVFLGLEAVALYSNYYIFYTSINTVCVKIYGAVTHSIGNLHTTNDKKYEYLIFKVMELITAILGGTAFVGVYVVADEFINAWMGKAWIIPGTFAFFMGLEVYTLTIRIMLTKYRNALGLFQQAKYRPIFGAIVNIIVSVVLVTRIGIVGVVIGTIIADWTTFMVFDPVIIHKYGFGQEYKVKNYYINVFKHLLIALISAFLIKFVCVNLISGYGWITVIVSTVISGIGVPAIYMLVNLKTKEAGYLVDMFMGRLKKSR